MRVSALLLSLGLLLGAGCATTPTITEQRALTDQYALAAVSGGGYCVINVTERDWLCPTTTTISELGQAGSLIAVRIDVPDKEYLVLDTVDQLVWVISEDQFAELPWLRDTTMVPVDEAWNRLAGLGV